MGVYLTSGTCRQKQNYNIRSYGNCCLPMTVHYWLTRRTKSGIIWLVLRCSSSIWSHSQCKDIMLQPANRQNYTTPSVKAGNIKIRLVDKFCYLGSVLSSSTSIDDDISSRLSKASVAFGRLSKHLCLCGAIIAFPFYPLPAQAPFATKPQCIGLSRLNEDTGGPSLPAREFSLTACPLNLALVAYWKTLTHAGTVLWVASQLG